MKKLVCICIILVAIFAMGQCRMNSIPVLNGMYVSDYATYYEFISPDTVVIGDSIEGEVYSYIITPKGMLYLKDETNLYVDSLHIYFSTTSDSFTIVDEESREQTTFHHLATRDSLNFLRRIFGQFDEIFI